MNPPSLDEFAQTVRMYVDRGQSEEALREIVWLVELAFRDTDALSLLLSSRVLDDLCGVIGAAAAAHQSVPVAGDNSLPPQRIYIASELFPAGGHTRVLQDFIALSPDTDQLVLIDDLRNEGAERLYVPQFEARSVRVEVAPSQTLVGKFNWLYSRLCAARNAIVFLLVHHHDAPAIAAVQSARNRTVFVHHADHQLCLGVHLPHVLHVDLHNVGHFLCRHTLGLPDNAYWPLVAFDRGARRPASFMKRTGPITTCSSGAERKFTYPYPYCYFEVMAQVLATTGGSHLHIGPLAPRYLDTIRASLSSQGIPFERFRHIAHVESIWDAMEEHNVDLYLASFPLGGGRTSIEVMGSGTPILAHWHTESRLLCGTDLIYPEARVWSDIEGLVLHLRSLSRHALSDQSLLARAHYQSHYVPEKLAHCLAIFAPDVPLAPPPMRTHETEVLRQYLFDLKHKPTSRRVLLWMVKRMLLGSEFLRRAFRPLMKTGNRSSAAPPRD